MAKARTQEAAERRLAQREEAALTELHELGAKISLHEPRHFVESDPLRGVRAGWQAGTCVAVLYSVDGKRKQMTGVSAVQVLEDLHGFLNWQERRGPDAPNRFEISPEPTPAVDVIQRQGSEQVAHDVARRSLEFSATGDLVAVEEARR